MPSIFGGSPPAFGNLSLNDPPVTPYRGSLLRLDVPTYMMVEPPFGMTRVPAEMSRHPESQAGTSNVHLLDEDGWELLPMQANVGYVHERQETQSSIVEFTVPSGFNLFATYRQPSDQPGALTGASGNISTTGDPFYGKKVGSSDSLDDAKFHNAADQAAMPSPDTSDNTIVMDRIGIGVGNHDPNQGFFIRFRMSGGKITAADLGLHEFFSGPAGVDKTFKGIGYFSARLHGDGNLSLYERGTRLSDDVEIWRRRLDIRYCPSGVATTGTHRLWIRPVTYVDPKGSTSGHIYFYHEGSDRSGGGSGFTKFSGTNSLSLVAIYSSPNTGATKPVSTPRPHRYDQRRAERHEIQVSHSVYPNTGVLQCDGFAVDSYILSTKPLRCYWWGIVPVGCSVDIKAYDLLTDVELTAEGTTGSITDGSGNTIGGYRYYTITYPQRQFYVIITLTGNADLNGGNQSSKTPIVQRYQILKDGRVDNLAPTEVTTKIQNPSILGPDNDPTHESGSCTVNDPGSLITILNTRGAIPFILQTRYDATDANKVSRLMQGWAKGKGERRGVQMRQGFGLGGALRAYPNLRWKRYEMSFVGEWMRLSAARMPFRWDFSDPSDPSDFGPKVTECIRQGFAFAGYPDSQRDIPDLATRMFVGSNPEMRLDPLADVGEFIMHLAMDYLGSFICWDANAQVTGSGVDRGIWRLRPSNYDAETATAKGPILAHFHADSATDANKLAALAVPHALQSYPVEVDGSQNIQQCYIRKGSLHSDPRPPEANIITVTGTGNKLFGSGRDAEQALTVTLANPASFNFAGLNPSDPGYPDRTNPDYLGFIAPYVFSDLNIRTIEGVQWVARRIYQRLCHGGLSLFFEAPLVLVTDSSDTLQIRPRPLRFYDAVKVDDIVFFVKSVAIKYVKDRVQMAVYELELPNGVLY